MQYKCNPLLLLDNQLGILLRSDINDRLYLINQQKEIENLQNENENLLKDLKEL